MWATQYYVYIMQILNETISLLIKIDSVSSDAVPLLISPNSKRKIIEVNVCVQYLEGELGEFHCCVQELELLHQGVFWKV